MSGIEYSPIAAEAYRGHMNAMTRASGCVRLYQAQPIDIDKLGHATTFERIHRGKPIEMNLLGRIPVLCLSEESPDEFVASRSNIAYVGATLENGVKGHIRLETLDEKRQIESRENDRVIIGAKFVTHVDNQYWEFGIFLDNTFAPRHLKVTVNYPGDGEFTFVDLLDYSFVGGGIPSLLFSLGHRFDVHLKRSSKNYLQEEREGTLSILAKETSEDYEFFVNNFLHNQMIPKATRQEIPLWSGDLPYKESVFHGNVEITYMKESLLVSGRNARWKFPINPLIQGVDLSNSNEKYTGQNVDQAFEKALLAFEAIAPHFDLDIPHVHIV
jgi:hypothetical protein